jgi:beta-alanine--pyruvate transaminase
MPALTSADVLPHVDLDALVMPFTNNRQFKAAPRLLARAKDMHYWTVEGREILDGVAGLWCCNAGHSRTPIVEAIAAQAQTMDFAPPFQMGHPLAFEVANRLRAIAPPALTHSFLCNSGSEAVDTAMKMALAYHRLRGEGTRTRFIGRERGYHGVGFGGMAVGGIGPNRKAFGAGLAGVDHLPHTHLLPDNAFSKGLPLHGVNLADALERLVTLHDASTIAAVIVEPMAGSTGVLLPPQGYLERLRAITSKYGILLIFDEVITGFGRLGHPFAAQAFSVTPDLLTFAKGVTSGTVPMGGVLLSKPIQEALMNQPAGIEFAHGYTYSGHPLACAAAVATLDLYQAEGLLTRATEHAATFEQLLHSLQAEPNVIDVRNFGLVGAVEVQSRPGALGARAYDVFLECFRRGVLLRQTQDIIALSPPLIAQPAHLEQIVETLRVALRQTT